MGWFGLGKSKSSSEVSDIQREVPSNHDHPLQPPTIEQKEKEKEKEIEIERLSTGKQFKEAINSIRLEDFKLENLVKIPCFRNAGLTGFSTCFVFFPIMFIYHKNILKATHWSVAGFFIGSILGWEQCQSIQKKSIENVRIAQELYQKKQELKYSNSNR